MHHHRHIDIIEMAFIDQLALAADEMNFSLFSQAFAVINFHILFSRYSEKYGIPGKFFHHARLDNPCSCRQHGRHLKEMSACMSCSRQRIRFRTVRCTYRIQFGKYCNSRSVFFSGDLGLDSRKRKPRLRIQSETAHIRFYLGRRLRFLETELRLTFNIEYDLMNCFCRFINRPANGFLHFFFCHSALLL